MSKQTFELPPPVEPNLALPRHASDIDTFGLLAVTDHESLIQDLLTEDYVHQNIRYAAQLEKKNRSGSSQLVAGLGSIAGSSLNSDEQRFLSNYQNEEDTWHIRAEDAKNLAEGFTLMQAEGLNELRSIITRLSEKETKFFEHYCRTSLPTFLVDVANSPYSDVDSSNEPTLRDEKDHFKTWQQWFGETASDDQLLNFLQWHVDMLDHQQDSIEVQTYIDIHKLEYVAAVKEGIEAGRLHPEAAAAIDEIDGIKVIIGDAFDTLIKGWGGYHHYGSDRVVIAQGYGTKEGAIDNLRKNMKHALKHEFNHAVLSGMGHPVWFEEAMTEHNARVFENGFPGEFNPYLRPEAGSYPEEQSLIDVLATCGDTREPVPADLFTRFYSARSPEAKKAALDELSAALEEKWGFKGVLVKVTEKINEYQAELLRQRVQDKIIGSKGADKTDMEIMSEAVGKARSDLLQQPYVISGNKKELAHAS